MQSKSTLVYWLTSPLAACLVLLGLTWIAYYDSLDVVFHFDDLPFIVQNRALADMDKHWSDFFALKDSRRAVPLLTFSFNYMLHSLDVTGYHVFNICLHAFNGFLIFLLVSKLLSLAYGSSAQSKEELANSIKFVALSVAAIFVVHPLLTASVTYITQRSGQLATFFYVSAFLSYLQMRRYPFRQPKFWAWGFLTILCFWLSFKSKEMALTWPMIPFVYEIAFRLHDWEKLKRVLKWVLGLLVCFAMLMTWYLTTTNYLTGNYFVGFNSATLWGPWTHLQTMLRVLFEYWKLLVLPLHQWMNIDHSFEISSQRFDIRSFGALGFHLALGMITLFLARKGRPLFAFGVGWFYVAFGPYILVPERDVMVEYKTYLPSVSLMCILADLLFWLRQKVSWRPYLYGVITIILVLGIGGTIERNKDYYTTASVWKDAINKAPYKARTLHNLGYAYAQEGHNNGAKVYFQKALQMSPGFVLARLNLARVFSRQGLHQEGLKEYEMMLHLSKNFSQGELASLVRDALFEAANSYRHIGQTQKAIEYYQKSLNLQEYGRVNVLNALAKTHMELGQLETAKKFYLQVMHLEPNVFEVNLNLGIISLKLQQIDEALQWFLRTLEMAPNSADVYNNLGIVQTLKGNQTAALQAFKKALQIDPNHQQTLTNLKAMGVEVKLVNSQP